MVATQGLADLGEIRSEGGADAVTRRVLSQVDFVVAHRQPEPQSADVLAAMAGTRPTWITTRRVDSRWAVMPKQATGTRSREREYVRHPDEFKRLAIGEAIVIEPAAATPAEVVTVWPAHA